MTACSAFWQITSWIGLGQVSVSQSLLISSLPMVHPDPSAVARTSGWTVPPYLAVCGTTFPLQAAVSCDSVRAGVGVGVGRGVGEGVGVTVGDGEGDGEGESVGEGVTVGVADAADGDAVAEGEFALEHATTASTISASPRTEPAARRWASRASPVGFSDGLDTRHPFPVNDPAFLGMHPVRALRVPPS